MNISAQIIHVYRNSSYICLIKQSIMDKSTLLYILNEWNYWDKPVPEYVPRPFYQANIDRYSQSGEVVVLKGVRRSGKSTLLVNQIRQLQQAGVSPKETLLVNFEDPRLGYGLDTSLLDQILEVFREYIHPENGGHFFLDEVQLVSRWEQWIRTGYELKRGTFYVTGSSSKLLSREFGTALGGRYLGISVFPLGFGEYLKFLDHHEPDRVALEVRKMEYKRAFNRYITEGGFPKLQYLPKDLHREEVMMYFESIILKDIVARYSLRNVDNVRKIALYFLSNIGKPFNINNIRNAIHVSHELTETYFEYLKEAFLLFEINEYHDSVMKQLAGSRKVYCVDNGFLTHVGFRISEDYGRYLENLVCIELLRRGKEVFFYQGRRGCDFLIRDGLRVVTAIQVTRSLRHEETRRRELEGLYEAMEHLGLEDGLILTEDETEEITTTGRTVLVRPVWRWLLGDE
jgi:uncharacterized protein